MSKLHVEKFNYHSLVGMNVEAGPAGVQDAFSLLRTIIGSEDPKQFGLHNSDGSFFVGLVLDWRNKNIKRGGKRLDRLEIPYGDYAVDALMDWENNPEEISPALERLGRLVVSKNRIILPGQPKVSLHKIMGDAKLMLPLKDLVLPE